MSIKNSIDSIKALLFKGIYFLQVIKKPLGSGLGGVFF